MQNHGAAKRRKEIARQEKQREKEASRLERRKQLQHDGIPIGPEEDPDIAGIVPGPQPSADSVEAVDAVDVSA